MPDHLDDERIDIDRHQRAPSDVEALDRLLGIHGSDQTGRGILRRQAGGPCFTDWARVLDIGIGDEHLPRITAAHGADEFIDEAFAGCAKEGDCGLGKAIGDREVDVAAQGFIDHLEVIGRIGRLHLGDRGELVILQRNAGEILGRGFAAHRAIVGNEQGLIGKGWRGRGKPSAHQRDTKGALSPPQARGKACPCRQFQNGHEGKPLWEEAGQGSAHGVSSGLAIIPKPLSFSEMPL